MTAELFDPADTGSPTRLRASRCPACARTQFPAAPDCPACGTDTRPVALDGPARLVFATRILAAPPDSLVAAPYDVGVAEFAGGTRVIGLLDGSPDRGTSVRPIVIEPADGLVTFAFGPA
jgi:uncharacterized OB-fold protein